MAKVVSAPTLYLTDNFDEKILITCRIKVAPIIPIQYNGTDVPVSEREVAAWDGVFLIKSELKVFDTSCLHFGINTQQGSMIK